MSTPEPKASPKSPIQRKFAKSLTFADRLIPAHPPSRDKSPTYNANPLYKARIARFKRRAKARKLDFYSRTFNGCYFIMRGRALRLERDLNRGFHFRHLVYLMLAKHYLTASGKDSFTAKDIQLYSRHISWTTFSWRGSLSYALQCERLLYLNPLTIDGKISTRQFVLSMKTRQIFREIEREFKSDYDVLAFLPNDKA